MASDLPEATRKYFRKRFDHFDRDGIQRVDTKFLPKLIRICGGIPLEADIDELKMIADPGGRGSFDFNDFCKSLMRSFQNSIFPESVVEAFRDLDPEYKGFIPQYELRYLLTTLGDALSVEEINEFTEELKVNLDMEGNVVYSDLVFKMTPEILR
ncbi:unnamed protein product [Phytomonas sp. Hart1]|nr:unnamed protein product [Phytomonas sp. Hart1]|eukprot:CCW68726.1 unnamed protein product [Phytomonas sp. isolate Hart1]